MANQHVRVWPSGSTAAHFDGGPGSVSWQGTGLDRQTSEIKPSDLFSPRSFVDHPAGIREPRGHRCQHANWIHFTLDACRHALGAWTDRAGTVDWLPGHGPTIRTEPPGFFGNFVFGRGKRTQAALASGTGGRDAPLRKLSFEEDLERWRWPVVVIGEKTLRRARRQLSLPPHGPFPGLSSRANDHTPVARSADHPGREHRKFLQVRRIPPGCMRRCWIAQFLGQHLLVVEGRHPAEIFLFRG